MSRYKEGDKFENVKVTLKVANAYEDDGYLEVWCAEFDDSFEISINDFDALVNPVTRLRNLKVQQEKIVKEIAELENKNV